MKLNVLGRAAFVAGAAIALQTAPATASVVLAPLTYTFTGTCIDCGGTLATGTLRLKNYTPGSNLSAANYVSFSYDSSLMPGFAFVGAPAFISGALPLSGGGANFTFIGASTASTAERPLFIFVTSAADATWSLVSYDFGVAGVWSAPTVPEPATWAMFIGGFGAIGGTLRARRRTTVRFAA